MDEMQFETREEAEKFVLARLEEAETAGDDKRLAAALGLRAACRFFNRPKDWRAWAKKSVPLAKKHVNRLLKIATSDSPAEELARYREIDRLNQQRFREARRPTTSPPGPDLEGIDWYQVAVQAVLKLDTSERLRFQVWLREQIGG